MKRQEPESSDRSITQRLLSFLQTPKPVDPTPAQVTLPVQIPISTADVAMFDGKNQVDSLYETFSTMHDPLEELHDSSEKAIDMTLSSMMQPKWNNMLQTIHGRTLNSAVTGEASKNGTDVSWDSVLSEDTSSLTGDVIMRRINFVLDNIPGLVRHEYQIQFHAEINDALIPKIYEKEWAAHSSTILKRYGIKKYQPERLICTPRRFGKTTSVIMYIIAVLYCIPRITVAIFSTGKRTASKLKNGVLAHLRTMPKFEELCCENNAEQVAFRFNANDTRMISCYPGTVAVCSFFNLVRAVLC